MKVSGWLRSQKACTLFLYSSWVIVCMGIFMAFMATPWFRQIESLRVGEVSLRLLGGGLGVAGAPAAIILLFGMAAFCVREDDSPMSEKIVWLLVFLSTACFGAALYFFVVYRKRIRGSAWPI